MRRPTCEGRADPWRWQLGRGSIGLTEEGAEKPSDDTRNVFVNYVSAEGAVTNSAYAALEKAGVSCWIAPRDVAPGRFYPEEIVRAIDAASALVLVLSQHSANSHHVLREVERAASKRHPVISLRTDNSPVPAGLEYFLNSSQWLDAPGAISFPHCQG